ncbi:alpha-L-fucosidase [Parafilimonas sp.]|uniref:alpha-L-fucosidase n=1 Tax=Parafilimonas sp. TaxID=1969739 RepID=UPI0039E36648
MKTAACLASLVIAFQSIAQQADTIQYRHTTPVNKGDGKAVIINKAAHVIPTANQYIALKNEFIAFVHFGPNTFTGREWGTGGEDPKVFDLKELHTSQWCKAMKAAGIKMVILTVKHHDGFVIWQSRYTTHGIMSSDFENGKGDVLKDLSASCKEYGLKLGLYLSPDDLFQIESPTGLYGNLSKYTMRTIPREVPGRPFANKTKFRFLVDDYNEYFLNQLFELLTEYGPIYEVWFDGATPKTKGGQTYNYKAWETLVHKLAPKAVMFGQEDVRWCGNESGKTRATEWNVLPFSFNPDTANHFPDLNADTLGSREQVYKAKYLHYQQAETNTSIREGWFYRDDSTQKVRSADDVFDMYERAVGGNSTFLLNIPPNRQGKFSPEDVKVLNDVGNRIRETYGVNLFEHAKGPAAVLDKSDETYTLVKSSKPYIIVTTPSPVTINRIVLQEAVATHSERVEKHAVDAWINGQWKEIAAATNIGYKRILRFPETTSGCFRLRILESRATPAISHFSAHYYKSRPPQLQVSRDAKGMVTIEPLKENFNWKPHGEHASKNLNADAKIYYTLDGSVPTTSSALYTEPFLLDKGQVTAVAIDNNERGAIVSNTFGIAKGGWKLLQISSEIRNHTALSAFDADNDTWWQSKDDGLPQSITIDFGKTYTIKSFAYTPQNKIRGGMMAKGIIQISKDRQSWADAGNFEFGNLVNDPTTRSYIFPKSVTARYVRVQAAAFEGAGNFLTIAELDFFEQ